MSTKVKLARDTQIQYSTLMGRKVKRYEVKEVRLKAVQRISVSQTDNLIEFLLGALPSDDQSPVSPSPSILCP